MRRIIGTAGDIKLQSLQERVDAVIIGGDNLASIERRFGKPESMRKGVDWRQGEITRTIYSAEYPRIGLTFALFTNPSLLYSITIKTKDVAVHSIRIGDSLEKVEMILGRDVVETTDGKD